MASPRISAYSAIISNNEGKVVGISLLSNKNSPFEKREEVDEVNTLTISYIQKQEKVPPPYLHGCE